MAMQHFCKNPQAVPVNTFFQPGRSRGRWVLVIGESPASKGWRESGKAFYTRKGTLLASGRNLNMLLQPFKLRVESVGITELVKCYPWRNKTHLDKCARKGWVIVRRQLSYYKKYRLLIPLGVKTTHIIQDEMGTVLPIGKISGVRIDGRMYAVLPIYHPSPRNPKTLQKNLFIMESAQSKIRSLLRLQKHETTFRFESPK